MARKHYTPNVGNRNRAVHLLILCTLAWSAYMVLFVDGEFSIPPNANVAMSRIGFGVKATVAGVESEIQETNNSMHGVVRGRNDLNDKRIERDTAAQE